MIAIIVLPLVMAPVFWLLSVSIEDNPDYASACARFTAALLLFTAIFFAIAGIAGGAFA